MPFQRKYGTLLVTGTTSIRIPIIKRAVVDFALGADWTPAAGDVRISVDGAANANVTNLPTAIAAGNTAFWEFILTAAELTGKQMIVTVADAATKAVEDQSFIVETYGNASAMYVTDFSAQLATPTNITAATGVVLSGVTHTGAVIPTVSAVTGLTAATVHSDLDDIQARLPAALTAGGNIKADALAWNGLATVALPATPTNITAATGIVLSGVTHTGAVIPTVTTLTGHTAQTGDNFSRIGAAGAGLTALGDTRIANLDATVSSRATPAQILTTAMTESYAADGAAPTLAQAICLIQQTIGDFSISGTTLTVKKLDGTTAAATYTLDDATNPTSRTRAT